MKVLLMYPPQSAHLAALQAAAPKAEFCIAHSEAEAQSLITNADAVLGNRYFLQALPYARQLRWMQSNSMGMDRVLSGGERLSGITITCARGVYDSEMADHTLALLLALTRGLHLIRDNQHNHIWQRLSLTQLEGKTAMILGWGGVGQAVAQRLLAFGVRVKAVRRSHAGPPVAVSESVMMYGPDTWRSELGAIHFLIMALPLTQLTTKMVGTEELNQLSSEAYLVNVGRGGSLDEAALLEALKGNRLAGAALDVFDEEPLPPAHPAWREPKLLISPHLGRSPETPPFRWEPLFVENLRRFASGEALLNVVDQSQGY
jgi:phosphoglycerate dehydrogenase-like enzyme